MPADPRFYYRHVHYRGDYDGDGVTFMIQVNNTIYANYLPKRDIVFMHLIIDGLYNIFIREGGLL